MAEEDFQPSDALPPTGQDRRGLAGIGAFLPMTVPKTTPYGEVSLSDIEMGMPPALKDAYSGIMKFGALMRGELSPQEIQQLAFDTSMNVTGGTLLGSQLLPKALPKGALGMAASKIPDDLNLGSGSLFSPEIKKGRKLLIVSCSADKCPDPGDMEAFDRYTGDMFKSIKKQGIPEENVDLAIMSAKYGLIRRDTKIPNYNVKMDKEIANNLLDDPTQVNRIKNTIEGYDEVVVEGSSLYKDVIKKAAGDAPITDYRLDYEKTLSKGERSNYGSGRQKQSVGKFIRSNTPQDVFHYTPDAELGFTVFDPNKATNVLDALGTHVGTAKAASDRYKQTYGKGFSLGSLGYDKSGVPIARTTRGGTYPLKADVSKPYTPDKFYEGQVSGIGPSKEVWGESDIYGHLLDEYNKNRGTRYTMRAMYGDEPDFPFSDFRKFIGQFRKKLAKDGFTHLPYYNEVEDYGSISYVMLTDRPKDSKAVLKGKFGKNDPRERTNPDIMKEEGGVVSMKDKAVNMNRGPRGIEPFVQYFENGGIVQSVKDYIGSFFEDEPIVPERNVFEEQRIVAENSPYPKDMPIIQTEKEALSDLADREMGLELLSKFSFDPMAYKIMQAGLRDNRPLSDFVEIYPTLTKAERQKMSQESKEKADLDKFAGLGLAMGVYRPLDNMIMVEPMMEASEYFQSPTDMIITHELLHKGAETLKKDPNVNIRSLREMLDADDYKNIGDDTERGRAEHRYIQAITNQALVDDMLQQTASYGLRGIAEAEKILKDPKSSSLAKKDARRQIKQIPKYIARNQKLMLIDEIRRSTNLYMEDFDKEVFKKNVEIILPNSKIFDYYITYDDKKEINKKFTLKQLKQVFDLTNMIMLNQPATKDFAYEMSKAAPAGASIRGYSDLFPEQFADPVRPFERSYLDIGPDSTYFDVMRARNKFLEKKAEERKNENKAEGGVIGLKDKAVNMYRNRL